MWHDQPVLLDCTAGLIVTPRGGIPGQLAPHLCVHTILQLGWNISHPTSNDSLYFTHPSKLLDGPVVRWLWAAKRSKSTFVAGVVWMVQLKSLSHSKIPIMTSHGAWHIFDDRWKGEDVWVQKEKVAVIDEDCEICSLSQMEKDLVIFIIRSDSFPKVQGKISSKKRMRDVLNPKRRIHEWFILKETVKKWKK